MNEKLWFSITNCKRLPEDNGGQRKVVNGMLVDVKGWWLGQSESWLETHPFIFSVGLSTFTSDFFWLSSRALILDSGKFSSNPVESSPCHPSYLEEHPSGKVSDLVVVKTSWSSHLDSIPLDHHENTQWIQKKTITNNYSALSLSYDRDDHDESENPREKHGLFTTWIRFIRFIRFIRDLIFFNPIHPNSPLDNDDYWWLLLGLMNPWMIMPKYYNHCG